ncbi:MAG: hypothetical protein WCG28_03560 [bacterium]
MIYEFDEKKIVGDQQDFMKKVLNIVIPYLATSCQYYQFGVFADKKIKLELPYRGELPEQQEEKEKIIQKIMSEIFEKSDSLERFQLFLDNQKISRWRTSDDRVYMFEYSDDNSSWVLNLSDEQFQGLQRKLNEQNLPIDLFVLVKYKVV